MFIGSSVTLAGEFVHSLEKSPARRGNFDSFMPHKQVAVGNRLLVILVIRVPVGPNDRPLERKPGKQTLKAKISFLLRARFKSIVFPTGPSAI